MKKEKIFNFIIVSVFIISMLFLFFLEQEKTSIITSKFDNKETLIIDAGHGGEDGGAIGAEGIIEKQINLSVCKKLELICQLLGKHTQMTRREDVSLSLDEDNSMGFKKLSDMKKRVAIINNTQNATLISIHQNSFPQDNCSGAQVFYSENNILNKDFARIVQETLKEGINNNNNRVEKESGKSIYILKNVNCPAILVECGFITNPMEAKLLKKEVYQTKLALSISAGLMRYEREMK